MSRAKRVLMLDDSDERAISAIDRIHARVDEQQAAADVAPSAAGRGAHPRRGRGTQWASPDEHRRRPSGS